MKALFIYSMAFTVVSMLFVMFTCILYQKFSEVIYKSCLREGIISLALGLLGILYSHILNIYGITLGAVNLGIFCLMLYYCHWNDDSSWPCSLTSVLMVSSALISITFFKESNLFFAGNLFLSGQTILIPAAFLAFKRDVDPWIVTPMMHGIGCIILLCVAHYFCGC